MSVEMEQVEQVENVDEQAVQDEPVDGQAVRTETGPIVLQAAPETAEEVLRSLTDTHSGVIHVPNEPGYTYVHELERRLMATEMELAHYKEIALAPDAQFIARVKGAALKPDKDGRLVGEIKLEIPAHECDLSKWARVAEITAAGEGSIRVSLIELVAQGRLAFDGAEEPQAQDSTGDEPGTVDADEAQYETPEAPDEDGSPEGESDPLSVYSVATEATEGEKLVFTNLDPSSRPDISESGLPIVSIEANIDMGGLAEAAYQVELPECVIELVRTVRRGDQDVQQTMLYHYQGPGGEPIIERITSARLPSWVREMQARRSA